MNPITFETDKTVTSHYKTTDDQGNISALIYQEQDGSFTFFMRPANNAEIVTPRKAPDRASLEAVVGPNLRVITSDEFGQMLHNEWDFNPLDALTKKKDAKGRTVADEVDASDIKDAIKRVQEKYEADRYELLAGEGDAETVIVLYRTVERQEGEKTIKTDEEVARGTLFDLESNTVEAPSPVGEDDAAPAKPAHSVKKPK